VRLFSLVASTLRMDLVVGMYLESIITHMLRRTAKTEELLPDRWTAAHPQAVREYREREYRERERRDKADMAVVQAARRRVRAELRNGK
jgi:isopentenyldiphosphate isomerase